MGLFTAFLFVYIFAQYARAAAGPGPWISGGGLVPLGNMGPAGLAGVSGLNCSKIQKDLASNLI
jgi:hypothetical protein